jgi:hypothetical protein
MKWVTLFLVACSGGTASIADAPAIPDAAPDVEDAGETPLEDAGTDSAPDASDASEDAGPMLGRPCDVDATYCDLPKRHWTCFGRKSDMYERCTIFCDDFALQTECRNNGGRCATIVVGVRPICVPE